MAKKKVKQRTGSSGVVPTMPESMTGQGEPTQPLFFEEDGKYMARKVNESKTRLTGFVKGGGYAGHDCGSCAFFCAESGCSEPKVQMDTDVPDSPDAGYKAAAADDTCDQYQAVADGGTLKTTHHATGTVHFNKFVPITKVDEAKREVGGIVTAEVQDNVGECCHYKTTKPYYEQWSTHLYKTSGGKNLGNLREMHGLVAAGAGKSLTFDDEAKTIAMTFKVVDDNAWKKVVEGVYTGFSHGGDYIKKWDSSDGTKMYTAKPTEVSLVDLPCLPAASFSFVRADGSTEMRKFATVAAQPSDSAVQVLVDAVLAKLGKHDKPGREDLLPATLKLSKAGLQKTAANRSKLNRQVEDVIHKVANNMGLKKDMYNVRCFAQLLQDLAYIRMSCEYEAQREDDGSQLPEALQNDLESLAETFLSMAQEEVGELVTAADSAGDTQTYAFTSKGGTMKKLTAADIQKAVDTATRQLIAKLDGVAEAQSMGDDEPEAIDPKKKGTKPTAEEGQFADAAQPKTLKTEHKLENGDTLKVYSNGETETIAKGSQPITEGAVAKLIEEGVAKGIETGLQVMLKAMYGSEEEADAVIKAAKAKKPAAGAESSADGSASGSASGAASGSASGDVSKVAKGIGDRANTPAAGQGPVVKVMPVTKTEDNRMTDAVLKNQPADVKPEDVMKALSGDVAAGLKLMKGTGPTEVPPTVADALSKIAGARA